MTDASSFEMLKLEAVRERLEGHLRYALAVKDGLTAAHERLKAELGPIELAKSQALNLIEHLERRLTANAQQLDAARRKQS